MIYTDSQYVYRIPERKDKLKLNEFITKKGNQNQNSDMVKILIGLIESHSIEFVKVKAHQKKNSNSINIHENYNSEVDKIARQLVRESVKIFELKKINLDKS